MLEFNLKDVPEFQYEIEKSFPSSEPSESLAFSFNIFLNHVLKIIIIFILYAFMPLFFPKNNNTWAEHIKMDKFVSNCISSYTLGPCISIDKQLFPTKVCCPLLQYLASKPVKLLLGFGL